VEFFDAFPGAGGPRPPRGRRGKPTYEVPSSAPGDAVLIRTDEAVVWIGAVRAYSNGFEFTLRALREEPLGASPLVVRPFPPADPFTTADPFTAADPFAPADREGALRVGLRYADGRQAATQRWIRLPPPVFSRRAADPQAILLAELQGGGDALTWDADFWVSPLPPAGPVLFYASWPDAGAAEQRAEFDGTAIRTAAARAVRLGTRQGPVPDPGPPDGEAPGPSGNLDIPGPRPPAE
jgi:hypothetical protein